VVLAPVANSFIETKNVEGDETRKNSDVGRKNRIMCCYRDAAQANSFSILKSGTEQEQRAGVAGGRLVCSGFRKLSVAGWTERLELSGWARTEGSASAQLLACWTDDAQQVLRVDTNNPTTGAAWQRISLVPPAPPPRAMNVRLVAVARGGPVWFDDFESFAPSAAATPDSRISSNQVGYELGGPKTAVVAANFLPRSAAELEVQLLTSQGKQARKQSVPCRGRIHSGTTNDWGWYFWRVDFSEFRQPGAYRMVAQGERCTR